MAKLKAKVKPKLQPTEETYDNSNSGVLFINDKKRKGKKDPDMKGSFTDNDGNEYWLAAWGGVHKKHGKYLSIKATLKEEQESEAEDEDGDDLPF